MTSASERRKIIARWLREKGSVTFKEIKESFGVKRPSIHMDVKELNELGFSLEITKDKGRGVIVDSLYQGDANYEQRKNASRDEKMLVARYVTDLIIGSHTGDVSYKDLEEDKAYLSSSKGELLEELKSQNYGLDTSSLERKIKNYWRQYNRLIAIDSGTTNGHTASFLSTVKIPHADTNVQNLTVCTNSRNIYRTLGDLDVRVNTIVVGGSHLPNTSCIAGSYAMSFLCANPSLKFSIAVIGAMFVNYETLEVETRSQEEAEIKSELLQRAAIKIIVADNHKLVKLVMRRSWPFTILSANKIDLLVTNEPVGVPKESNSNEREEFEKAIRVIREEGVPVVVSRSATV